MAGDVAAREVQEAEEPPLLAPGGLDNLGQRLAVTEPEPDPEDERLGALAARVLVAASDVPLVHWAAHELNSLE